MADVLVSEAFLAVKLFLHVVVELQELVLVDWAALVPSLVADVCADVVL